MWKTLTLLMIINVSLYADAKILKASKVSDNRINEASGLVASRVNKEIYWTHNDSGDSAVIFAVGIDGSNHGSFYLKNLKPVDIEDITIGVDTKNGESYIYLADIGDNTGKRTEKRIYRFIEPKIRNNLKCETISNYDIIRFKYPDQKKYNAETILYDPFNKDLIVITKRGRKSDKKHDIVFSLNYPQTTNGSLTEIRNTRKIEVPTGMFIGYGITGGDISADGCQLILKTYTNIYYWQRKKGDNFRSFFKNPAIILPYSSQEGQGEAICFSLDGNYYLTMPEESLGEAYLSLYPLHKSQKK